MAKSKITPKKEIQDGKKLLKELMQKHLNEIAAGMIAQIMIKLEKLPESKRFDALNDVKPQGINAYKEELLETLSVIAARALDNARKSVPKAKTVKLHECDEDAIRLGEFSKLPADLRNRILTQNQLLIGAQIADLEKSVYFQFQSSVDSTDSMEMIQGDLVDAADDFIKGASIEAGAASSAAQVVSEARNAFFFQDDVLEEIDAFVFVNADPVSPICQDLNGTVFAKDDPNMFRYTPPLHFNCKSSIEPILKGDLGSREITPLKPSKSSLDKYVQFSEVGSCRCAVPNFPLEHVTRD